MRTELGGGLFEVPFRFELIESSMVRPFIERSWASQNMFPTERDLGLHVKTVALGDKLTVEAALINGQRLGEPHWVELPDLNASKDGVGRISYKLGPVTLGVFGYVGRGQRVDTKDLRFKNFPRSGVNFGALFAHKFFELGETRALGELLFAQNMDTGVRYGIGLPAIPTPFGSDVTNLNERGLYLRAEQDITKWALAGFRYDMYTTDAGIANNARDTYTLMAGAKFDKLLRLVNEATWIVDNIHASGAAAPSKHVFQYTAWLQGSFY